MNDDTPRTNVRELQAKDYQHLEFVVPANFARDLERENVCLRENLAQAENPWRPVSEPPDNPKANYLVSVAGFFWRGKYQNGTWVDYHTERSLILEATHWMEIPEVKNEIHN